MDGGGLVQGERGRLDIYPDGRAIVIPDHVQEDYGYEFYERCRTESLTQSLGRRIRHEKLLRDLLWCHTETLSCVEGAAAGYPIVLVMRETHMSHNDHDCR